MWPVRTHKQILKAELRACLINGMKKFVLNSPSGFEGKLDIWVVPIVCCVYIVLSPRKSRRPTVAVR